MFVVLFCACCLEVAWLVVSVHVDAVQRATIGALSHISIEIAKGVSPVAADFYPATTVRRETSVLRVVTPIKHSVVGVPFNRVGHAVFALGLPHQLSAIAAAASGLTGAQQLTSNARIFPTFATTNPKSLALKQTGIALHVQSAELFSRQVNPCRHRHAIATFYCITPPKNRQAASA
jgi:hypothetical protein